MFARFFQLITMVLVLLGASGGGIVPAGAAPSDDLKTAVAEFKGGGYGELEAFIQRLAEIGDDEALVLLDLLENGSLWILKTDERLVLVREDGDRLEISDPLTGESLGTAAKADLEKIRVNNRIRRAIDSARGALSLVSDDRATRLKAAEAVFLARDAAALPVVRTAIAKETDARVLAVLRQAEAAIILQTSQNTDERIAAVRVIKDRGDREALSLLLGVAASSDGELKEAAEKAAEVVQTRLDQLNLVRNIWFGVSLGSVLLLAAIGLAITFGVMGVINMAHGELVMLGAYTTYFVQQIFRTHFPEALDYSLVVAVPAAFCVAGGMGMLIERGIIRFLYGRALETLLATWGVSLILQQIVRSLFGPSNVEVTTPSWMSGTVDVVSGLSLTLNRIAIVIFTLVVFAGLTVILRRTSFGLRMRAVTQNRPMAGSVGINANWIDALTFGLGAGIAGIAGVALSQIDNVSPNLGQSYIIDSFLVVVFGGVGNLWGTLVGALTLGVANKFLEPLAGAVLAKIVILIGVILFIQGRPRGLFPMRGRAVEG